MSKTYDITMKHIEDHFGPDWASILPKYLGFPPETKTEPIDSDLSVTESQADKLYRLSGPVSALLHLELETGWAGEMPDRLLLYNVLAEHRHGGPVYSVVMLVRPESNSPGVTGELVRSNSHGDYLRFRYSVIRVWELSSADLMSGPIGLMPLALLTDDAQTKLPELVRQMDERVTRELGDSEDAHLLKTACSLLLGMRYHRSMIRRLFAGVTQMRESEGYLMILEEGQHAALLRTLFRLGRKRFGTPTPQVESQIKSINVEDLDRLDRMIDALETVKSWDELLQS